MASLSIQRAKKVFPSGVVALNDLNLNVADGELLTIVGPSGCGKTTLLRAIAGLELLDAGSIQLGEMQLGRLPPRQRDVAMVFQQPALYPNLRVAENIAFPLRMRKEPTTTIDERVGEIAAQLEIEPLLNRRPDQLSGGQAQRVALARALIRRPRCLLLDEPLSNLDAALSAELRKLMKKLHAAQAITTLYVTHNQDEALELGQRIAVMREGRIEQIGNRETIVQQPANEWVAGFFSHLKQRSI